MGTVIKPTVGRIVWFTPDEDDTLISGNEDGIYAAIVTKVWDDTRVNLAVFTAKGVNAARTSVYLLQDGNERPARGGFCRWMPYQLGQAAKHADKDASIPFLGETSDSAKSSTPRPEVVDSVTNEIGNQEPSSVPAPDSAPAETVPAAESHDVGSSETIASTEGVSQESAPKSP